MATLENSTKTLWLYRRNLARATASGDKRSIDSATGDLEMLARHSRYPSVKEAALKVLQDDKTTIQAPSVVRNLMSPVSHDVTLSDTDADAATA